MFSIFLFANIFEIVGVVVVGENFKAAFIGVGFFIDYFYVDFIYYVFIALDSKWEFYVFFMGFNVRLEKVER